MASTGTQPKTEFRREGNWLSTGSAARTFLLIALLAIATFALYYLAQERHVSRVWLAGASALVLLALTIVSYRQIGYWKNEATIWTHAAEVNPYHWLAQDNVASLLRAQAKPLEAMEHFYRAAAINPEDAYSNSEVGYYEQATGDLPGAIFHYDRALKDQTLPEDRRALLWRNLGVAYRSLGDNAKAVECFQKSARLSAP